MMVYQISFHRLRIWTVILSATTLTLSSGLSPAIAQSLPTAQASLRFPTGGDRGAPQRTTGPASRRESCSSQQQTIPLTAITPTNNVVKTIAANPSIYIYVPALTDKQAIFNVIDQQAEEVVYRTTISLNNSPGILKLSLPATVQLRPNKTYEWGFFIQCDPNDPIADEGIQGWIERTALSTDKESEIQQSKQSPLKQAQLYVEAGVWQEAIAILAELRNSNPVPWTELLESVGLEPEIARSPWIEE
jgi:Domain of Unknown Function (DUF928)